MRKTDVFVSYARKDVEQADRLVEQLTSPKLGLSVFHDIPDIGVGEEFRRKIEEAISECTNLIVIVTENTSHSRWVPFEFGLAKALKKKIVPWVPDRDSIDDADLPDFLRGLNATSSLEKVLASVAGLTDPIIVVGSASIEYVIKLDGDEKIALDSKQTVSVEERIGGSGVNYATRLLAHGRDVLPILPLANDIRGRKIQEELVRVSDQGSVSATARSFVNSDRFFTTQPGTKSQTSFVVVDNSNKRRTIFSERLGGPGKESYGKMIVDHLRDRVNEVGDLLSEARKSTNSVLIGHIHADNEEFGASKNMECTRMIMERFGKHSLTYANLGKSQFKLGIDAWGDLLHDFDVLQLNLEEAKEFFRAKSLTEILNALKEHHVTTVVTMEKFGAIGVHRDNPSTVYVTWPSLRASEIVDTTGSGDAFAAAMVAQLKGKKDFDSAMFSEALKTAAAWAAHACQSYGGAGNCPSTNEVDQLLGVVSERSGDRLEEILRILDIAFQ